MHRTPSTGGNRPEHDLHYVQPERQLFPKAVIDVKKMAARRLPFTCHFYIGITFPTVAGTLSNPFKMAEYFKLQNDLLSVLAFRNTQQTNQTAAK